LDRRRSRKTLLTKFGAKSAEMNHTKVVDNFNIFLKSIDTPSYDQQFKSYDFCKLGAAAEIYFWTEQDNWINLEFKPTSNGKLEEP
jgi:hypothetical protein